MSQDRPADDPGADGVPGLGARWPERILAAVVVADVFGMMALTFVDVIGRYVFNRPVHGAFEIIEFMMGLVIFAGLPLVTFHREHVTVSLLDEAVARLGLVRAQRLVVTVLSAVAVGFIAFRMWQQGGELEEIRHATGFLELPYAPLAYFMGAMAAVTVAVLLAQTWCLLRGEADRHPPS